MKPFSALVHILVSQTLTMVLTLITQSSRNGEQKSITAPVRDANNINDKNRITHARNAMIIGGLSLNMNGVWERAQLNLPELQNIINKHPVDYSGTRRRVTT